MERVAAVDARSYAGMNESLRHLLGKHTADPIDAARVEVRATADGPACSGVFENDAQVAHLISGRSQTVSNTDARDDELPFLLR